MNISKCTTKHHKEPLFFISATLETVVTKGKKGDIGKTLKEVLGLKVVATTNKKLKNANRTLADKAYLATFLADMPSTKRNKMFNYNGYFELSAVELQSNSQSLAFRKRENMWVGRQAGWTESKSSDVYIDALCNQ